MPAAIKQGLLLRLCWIKKFLCIYNNQAEM